MKCVDCGDKVAIAIHLNILQEGFEVHSVEVEYLIHNPDFTGLRCTGCCLKLIRRELEGAVTEITAEGIEEAA